MHVNRNRSRVGGLIGLANQSIIQNSSVHGFFMHTNGDSGGIAGVIDIHSGVINTHVHSSTLNMFISHSNRSIGGIVGLAEGIPNAKVAREIGVLNSTVNNLTISFVGSGNIAGRDLTPSMGFIIGTIQNHRMANVSQSGSTINRGTLHVYRFGLFNLSSHDQAQRVGRGPWQSYGRRVGNAVLFGEEGVAS